MNIFTPFNFLKATLPNDSYFTDSGTSIAALIVTSTASIIRSQYLELSAFQTREIPVLSSLN